MSTWPLRGRMGRPGVRRGEAAPQALTITPAESTAPSASAARPWPMEATAALEQPARGTGRIDHRIAGDEERTGEAGPKIGLGGGERGGIEDLGGHAAGTVVGVLAADLLHFFLVGGDPKRAAGGVLDLLSRLGRKLGQQGLPEQLG